MTKRSSAALAAVILLAATQALAGEARLTIPGGSVGVTVTSLKEARFKSVVRQQYDFSCGSAAIATLLTYHYGRPIGEEEAFRSMFAVGDQQAIQKYGFSLADMQRYLSTLGLRSDGFRVTLDKYVQVGVPAITLISTKGYNHFVVIKGIRGGDVLVGDPALGLKAIPRAEFEAMWQGVVFVVRDDLESGRDGFNRDDEWAVRRKVPFGTALNRHGLSTFAVALPGLFEF
ncbi:MAG TPA: C39 family peptidase [Candidatus Omnitrophota bacterium]|nr:C39 family peptidase [Candidatus Omnitrophota bacterium]